MKKIYSFLEKHWSMLFNSRGEVGDEDDPKEGDGDLDAAAGGVVDDESPYTEEEQKILDGQTLTDDDDPGKGEGGDDTDGDDKSGDDTPGSDGDGDETPAPWQEEIRTLKDEIAELKGEKKDPGKDKTGDDTDTAAKSSRDAIVEYDDGRTETLGDVYDRDPEAAFQINAYHATQIMVEKQREAEAAEREQQALTEQAEKEITEFSEQFAKDEFDKEYGELDEKEQAAVQSALDEVQGWMTQTGKWGITVSDAHFLMNKDTLITKAAGKQTDKVINDATRGGVRTIQTKADGKASTSTTENMANWDSARMSQYVDSLDGAEFAKFMSSASDKVKDKFPDLPWS